MSAAEHKEKGNAAFKAGDYPTAIGHYTSAILADDKDPTFPLNRAAAYLKLNKNEDAERDCTTVLKLQTNNVKALFRRAQARIAQGKLSDARADLVAAAKTEPGNAAVRAEFTKVEELIEAAKKAKASKGTPISLPTRPPPQPQPSDTPYRRRVPIAIVNDDAIDGEKKAEDGKGKADVAGAPLKGILKSPSSPSPSGPSTAKPTTSPLTSTLHASTAAPRSNDLLRPVSTRSISSTAPAKLSSQKPPTPAPTPPPAAAPSTPIQAPSVNSAKRTATTSTTMTSSIPAAASTITPPAPEKDTDTHPSLPLEPDPTPPTLLGFLQRWSNTRTDAERAVILFAIPPNSIPTLFGPTLESPLLGAILGALSWALASSPTVDISQRALSYLVALSRVPRFSTLVLFLDENEKKYARDVWDRLEKSELTGELTKERKMWSC